jgi:hypothetical protein
MPNCRHSVWKIFIESNMIIAGCTLTGVMVMSSESSFDKVNTSSTTRFWCKEHVMIVRRESMVLSRSSAKDLESTSVSVDASAVGDDCCLSWYRVFIPDSAHWTTAEIGFRSSWEVMSIKLRLSVQAFRVERGGGWHFSCWRFASRASSIRRCCTLSAHLK